MTYIPKQTVDRSRSSARQRYEERITANRSTMPSQDVGNDDEEDDEKPKDVSKPKVENPEEPSKVKFKSCKLE